MQHSSDVVPRKTAQLGCDGPRCLLPPYAPPMRQFKAHTLREG